MNIIALYKKELQSYFYSPIAYVFIVIFLLLPNIFFFYFFGGIFGENNASMRIYFTMLPYVFIVFIPGFTMGVWSEEKNNGTLELLFTLPISQAEILIGKFLASLTIVIFSLLGTLPIPILTHLMLGSMDLGQVISQYIGSILLACCCISITFFISSLTKELIVSFLLSASTLLALTVMGFLSQKLKFYSSIKFFRVVFAEMSLSTHFLNFSKGVIDSIDVLFYIGMTLIFFYINLRVLESKRWS